MPLRYCLWSVSLVAACVRPPAEALCPVVAPGELAITEVRGPGRGGSSPPWIEVRAERELELLGLRLRVRRPDGGAEHVALVRSSVSVQAGGHVVLGVAAPAPAEVGYTFGDELPWPWFPVAVLELESCDVTVDRMSHPVLPEEGTYSLEPPPAGVSSASHNDRATSWCRDASGPLVGTPGQENRPCR